MKNLGQKVTTVATPRLDHVPQLSIRYLLLWTATTAMALLAFNLMGLGRIRLGAFDGFLLAALAIVVGWIWMALGIIGWHFAQRSLWKLEPGECLLLGPGCLMASVVPLTLMYARLQSSGGVAVLLFLIVQAFAWAFYLVGASAYQHSSVWSALHFVNGLALFSPVLVIVWPVALLVWMLLPPVAFTLLAAAVLGDRSRHEPRHWLHFSGVALYGLGVLLLLLFEIRWVMS